MDLVADACVVSHIVHGNYAWFRVRSPLFISELNAVAKNKGIKVHVLRTGQVSYWPLQRGILNSQIMNHF